MRPRQLSAVVAGLVLLAFALRVLRLEFVNFNSDEAFFVQLSYQGTFMASMSIDEPHPPLFLALLQAWMGPAGVSQYAIRFLPVLYGTLLVPVIYQLGRVLGSRRLGVAAAFVVAVGPAFIFYAKEVRDNGLMAFTCALSFVLLFLAYRRPSLLPAYIVAGVAALASHYYAIPIVTLQLLVLAAMLLRAGTRRPWPWAAAPIAFALAYIPWLLYARSAISGYNIGRGSLAVVRDVLSDTARAFNYGFAVHEGDMLWPAIGLAALVAAGLTGLWLIGRGKLLGVTLAYLLAPLLFGLLTLLRQNNFAPRFLFAGAPAYALLLGAGLMLLWHWQWTLGALGSALLLGLTGLTVRNTDFTPEFQPNGYPQLAGYLRERATNSDGIVLDGVSQWPLYWYYGQVRSALAQRVEFLPRETLAQTEQSITGLLDAGGVWYLESDVLRYDPRKDVERLLASNGYQALDMHFAGQRLEYFAAAAAGPLTPMNVAVGPLQLVASTHATVSVPAGRAIGAELDWQHGPRGASPFKLSLRLEGPSGSAAQYDTLPLGGYFDFASWPPGQTMRSRPGLVVPPGTTPGAYRLLAVAYDPATTQGLGPPVDLGTILVE